MDYVYIDIDSTETKQSSLDFTDDIIKKPFEYLQKGSGDCAIQIKHGERLIFFKVEKGFCMMQHPDYLVPLIEQANSPSGTITHYIGGEPMTIPIICLCAEAKALEILQYYILTNGELAPAYKWVDIYDYMDYERINF
jgi:hypothetical protein